VLPLYGCSTVRWPGLPDATSVALPVAATGLGIWALAARMESSADSMALGTLGLEILIASVAVLGAGFSDTPWVRRLDLGPSRLSGTQLSLLVLGMLGTSVALDGVLDWTDWGRQSQLAELDRQLHGLRGPSLALAFLGFAIAPGIAEELLCRGLIQRGLTHRLGTPAAIVTAAMAFGVLHAEAIHGIFAAGLGLYLGTAAWLAGSVRAAIVCHLVNNLAGVALSALAPELPLSPAAAIAAGLTVSGGCLAAVWHGSGRRTGKNLQPPPGMDDP